MGTLPDPSPRANDLMTTAYKIMSTLARAHAPHRTPPPQKGACLDCRLRARVLRYRRGDGRASPRRARFGLRQGVRSRRPKGRGTRRGEIAGRWLQGGSSGCGGGGVGGVYGEGFIHQQWGGEKDRGRGGVSVSIFIGICGNHRIKGKNSDK